MKDTNHSGKRAITDSNECAICEPCAPSKMPKLCPLSADAEDAGGTALDTTDSDPVPKGSRICVIKPCGKRSSWGLINGARDSACCCSTHGKQRGYEDVRHKRCEEPGCTSLNRSYGPVGGLPASGVVCATHGQQRGYEDVMHKRCEEPGCTSINPTYGPIGGLPASGVVCATHGQQRGYGDVRSKRCEEPGCTSINRSYGPVGGLPTSAVVCATHGQQRGYEDVRSKRCEEPGCTIRKPAYGPVGGLPTSAVVCATHGQQRGYENVRSKRCEEPGCTIINPTYGPVGGLPASATHCSGHGRDKGYEDVIRKRCGSCKLRNFLHPMSKVAQCTECDHTLWPRIHKKEDAVAVLLQLAYGDQAVRRELAVSFKACGIGVDRSACAQKPSNNARLDFVIESMRAVVIVEVDEFQHSSYCGEISRVNEIFTAFRLGENIRHVHFVRFNPDAFKIDQKKGRVSLKVRHARLVEVIQKALDSHEPQKTWSILHMYYDTDENGRLCIMDEINMEIHPVFIPPLFKAPIIA